jgi:hypothetical protein
VHPLVTLPRPAPPPSASLPVDLSAQPTTAHHSAATYLALSIITARTHVLTRLLQCSLTTTAACPRAAESANHVRYQVTNSQARLPKTTCIPAVRRPSSVTRPQVIPQQTTPSPPSTTAPPLTTTISARAKHAHFTLHASLDLKTNPRRLTPARLSPAETRRPHSVTAVITNTQLPPPSPCTHKHRHVAEQAVGLLESENGRSHP